jgi:glyoxylase-like metal-dependent hydrolase (beta-lactamase superfamily II)
MLVETLEVCIGPGFTENCYIVSEGVGADAVVVVDPGAEADKVLAAVGERRIESIVLTHRHYDHVGAVFELVEKTSAKVIAHPQDAESIADGQENRGFGYQRKGAITVDLLVEDGDSVSVGNSSLTVLHTPGHTIGSICLYNRDADVLLAGDTLFCGAVGRTDFPTGSASQQQQSLNKLAKLPDSIIVYPGHDEPTSIGQEKRFGALRNLG